VAELSGRPCVFEDCDSSDAFGYNTEGMYGKCFSCKRAYPHKGMKLKAGM
jgi:hypothetical protein